MHEEKFGFFGKNEIQKRGSTVQNAEYHVGSEEERGIIRKKEGIRKNFLWENRAEGNIAKKEKKICREKQGSGFISHSKIKGKIMQWWVDYTCQCMCHGIT